MMDMAAGGQRAPLVPYVDYLLFNNPEKNLALLNIGGIANITILLSNGKLDDVYAFDTGPGNMVIDRFVNHYYHIPFDPNSYYSGLGKK
ncbi:anhydro-N-acetylmuramic acid kinase [Tuberibacillus calidus]|uniref:anhydro-N-acetylmuramic acid kinase n=1 Tax=Tuberibacillus calidus TaxID=340097 RepID=UPI003CCBAF4B